MRNPHIWIVMLLAVGCARPPGPRPLPPPEMVVVEAGPCKLGGEDADSFFRPPGTHQLETFWIDRTEVTHAQYQKFRPQHVIPKGQDKAPVTHISRQEAEAYLASLGKRLPTAEEWEKAARGSDGRIYPWGSDWDPSKGHLNEKARQQGLCTLTRMKPVGSFPAGASPYGCLDMCGNAYEWVSDSREGRPVIKGGAFGYRRRECRCSAYATEDPGFT